MKVREMTYTALFAAIICIAAPWSIPVGAIPLSLATLAVYVAASVMDWKHGTLAVLIYILIGAVGVPVFASFTGGVQKIAGVTGGFIIGYLPCAFITGIIVDRLENKKWAYPVAMLAGTAACYLCGTAWYMLQTGTGLLAALAVCVVPFLIGDAVKIVAASALAYPLRRVLKRQLASAA